MKRKVGKIFIAICLLIFLGGFSVSALSEGSVLYYFATQKVDVHLKEYTLRNGKYIPWEQGAVVLPGGYLSKIPVVYNDGVECYVRTQINISSEREASVPLTLDNIDGIGKDWVQIGDYFYYKEILPRDENITFFEGIRIPTEWSAEIDSGNRWSIDVKVDAIQAKYVTPDFGGDDPWNVQGENIAMLGAPEEEASEDEEMQGGFIFTIESQLEGFEVGMEQQFQNLGGFLPGDEKMRSVCVKNRDRQARSVYLEAEFLEETLLMRVMELEIVWETSEKERILYRGRLSDVKDVLRNMELSVEGNSTANMWIKISLPKSINNVFAAKEGNVKFTLRNEQSECDIPNLENPDHSVVQTGDKVCMWLWGVSGSIALVVIAGIVFYLCWRKWWFYDA